MQIEDIQDEVSEITGFPVKVVREVYRQYWKCFKESIMSLPFPDNDSLTEEEFSKIRNSYNIASIGKFGVTYDRYLGCWKRIRFKENSKGNV